MPVRWLCMLSVLWLAGVPAVTGGGHKIKNALCFASSRGWLAKRGPSSASARSLAPQLFGPTIVSSLRCTAVAPGKTDQALKASLAGAPGILRPISIPGSLAEDGIVSVPVDTEMVDEMVEMFEQLRKTTGNRFRRCGPVEAPVSRAGARENVLWTEQIPCDVEASNFRLTDGPREVYDVYTTGFAPTMRWVAVGDRDTLDRWDKALGSSIKHQLEQALGEPIVLCQACFVVVHGGVGLGEAKLHADWALEAIPRRDVYTALTPLTDFPPDVGGLIIDVNSMPKHEGVRKGPSSGLRERKELLHRYTRGEAVLFDGKLMHRTEPYANAAFERVLASFSFCTASSSSSAHLPDVIQVLGDQTPAFFVSPAGESGALPPQKLSYDAARAAVKAAGVSNYDAFWRWSRGKGVAHKLRMPVHPHKDYKDKGWVSWDHFFQR